MFLLFSRFIFCIYFFFFNDTATTEIYTLSLHDALPISLDTVEGAKLSAFAISFKVICPIIAFYNFNLNTKNSKIDRKSTRLNSSHVRISYAVFCLKKKNNLKCNKNIKWIT